MSATQEAVFRRRSTGALVRVVAREDGLVMIEHQDERCVWIDAETFASDFENLGPLVFLKRVGDEWVYLGPVRTLRVRNEHGAWVEWATWREWREWRRG